MEVLQFPLETCLGHSQMPRQVTRKPSTIRLHEEGREDSLSNLREQGIGAALSTHYAYICTQKGNDFQAGRLLGPPGPARHIRQGYHDAPN